MHKLIQKRLLVQLLFNMAAILRVISKIKKLENYF